MGEREELRDYVKGHKFLKDMGWKQAWEQLITVDIPQLMCIEGLVDGCMDVLPVYVVLDYYNYKYKGDGWISWTDMMNLENFFMQAWTKMRHPSLGVKAMKYNGRFIPCIYVKKLKRKKEG
jgi:hypothetical protein